MNYLQRKKQALTSQIQQGILPFGYRQVEYLESTGTQYIDTKIPCDVISKIQGKFYAEASLSSGYFNILFGARKGAVPKSNMNFWLGFDYLYNSYIRLSDVNFSNVKFPSLFEFEYIAPKQIRVNQSVYSSSGSANRQTRTLYLGTLNTDSSLGNSGTRRYYNFIIYDLYSNKLRDFIPCLDNNNKPCMYDTVSKQTFYNQGTGEFLYGEVIN